MRHDVADRGWPIADELLEPTTAGTPSRAGRSPDFAQVAGHCTAPIAVMAPDGIIVWTNPALERTLGTAAGTLIGEALDALQALPRRADTPERLRAALASRGHWRGPVTLRRRGAPALGAQAEIRALVDARGTPTHFVCTWQPARATAAHLDPLTGLLGRDGLVDAADRLCTQQRPLTLLTVDIDGFTAINEQLGWTAGDSLLQAVGRRCSELAAAAGTASLSGRVGADEFAVVFAGTPGSHDPGAGIRALLTGLAGEYDLPGAATIALDFSFGRCELPAEAADLRTALIHATAARQGGPATRDNISHYAHYRHECGLLLELREAVRQQRLQIDWQPQFDLRDRRHCGAEALARWTREDGTEISPSAFIPIAENDGLVSRIDDQVLDLALRDLARWRAQRRGPDRVAVNMSAAQLQRPGVTQRVAAALARHGVAPALLDIEITESVLLCHLPSMVETLRELHALGVGLSIDDFGTGYSSLAYLRKLPIDRVKLDRSFVADIVHHTTSREIVRAVVGLAERIGLRVVAEGVETDGQLAQLAAIGCHEAQGFLLGHPMAADRFEAWLETR